MGDEADRIIEEALGPRDGLGIEDEEPKSALTRLDELWEQSAKLHDESESIVVFDSYMLELGEKLSATYPELRELVRAMEMVETFHKQSTDLIAQREVRIRMYAALAIWESHIQEEIGGDNG